MLQIYQQTINNLSANVTVIYKYLILDFYGPKLG